MKLITLVSRILVGGLFIFSGLIKLNDPMGFAFKLNDYFAADVLNLPFLQDYTLALALFIVILEVILGVSLLIGKWVKMTVWLLLIMIVLFTFLTFYSAFFDKVTDCGCFGDAIPLTPWQSFTKDLILLVLIATLFFNQKLLKPIFAPLAMNLSLGLSLVLCIALGHHVLNHLPIKDFRAYAEGKSIIEGMKSAEELGLQATEYATIYTLENEISSDRVEVPSDKYISENWWQKKDWKIIPELSKTLKIKDGYEPPVHDFIIDLGGQEVTDEVLSTDRIFLLIAYRLENTEGSAYEKLNTFALAAGADNVSFIGLTASLPSVVAEKTAEWGTRFSFGSMDETALKTIVRANPGIVLLEKGVIVKKWHYQDLPEYSELAKTWN